MKKSKHLNLPAIKPEMFIEALQMVSQSGPKAPLPSSSLYVITYNWIDPALSLTWTWSNKSHDIDLAASFKQKNNNKLVSSCYSNSHRKNTFLNCIYIYNESKPRFILSIINCHLLGRGWVWALMRKAISLFFFIQLCFFFPIF